MGCLKVIAWLLLGLVFWGIIGLLVIVGLTLRYSWDIRWIRR